MYAGGERITAPELKEGLTEIADYINLGFPGYEDEVELPSSLKRIGAYAFWNNKKLYNVYLPEGLEEIGESAFENCELLRNTIFPSSLRKIDDNAFNGCVSLTEVILPEALNQLGNGVFKNCGKIEKAVLMADLESLGDELFSYCTSLYKLYLPLELKQIGNYTFACCSALDEVAFPSTLESIGDFAFDCANLTQLTIPDKVTSIGRYAFQNNSISNLRLGNGLTCIQEGAFKNNPLYMINFPEGLETIESYAFSDGGSEESWNLSLPSTVTKIAENAFANRRILDLEIPDAITSLPKGSCGSPTILTIGKGIKEIDSEAFQFDNLITLRVKAIMPPTLNEAFPITDDQNDKLTLIVNQGRKSYYDVKARWNEIKYIIEEESTEVEIHLDGRYPLAEEIRIQSGIMPSNVTKMKVTGPLSEDDLIIIKKNMISLQSIDLSEVTNLPVIPANQFAGSLLTEIILPEGVEGIGDSAFSGCRLLKMSELPETITSIGSNAFKDCRGVTLSMLPQSLEQLGEGVFAGCIGIQEISFGDKISGTLPAYIFKGCKLLGRVDLSNTNVTAIGAGAFSGCTELDEIYLPESVTSIGNSAFNGTAIRDLSFLPEDVETIEESAFSNCRRLVTATLPTKITSVSSGMFSSCPRLLTLSMPNAIIEVGNNIVNGNKKLSNISCATPDAPTASDGAFNNIRLRYVSLTVPTLSFRSYLSAPEWGKFESIQNRLSTSIGKGVKVTNVAEEDYQAMLEEDRLEALTLQAQKEEAKDEVEMQMLQTRAERRTIARAATDRSFAALFDGAQIQTGSDGSGTRIFLTPQDGVNVISILINGEEMIDKLEGNSLLLPKDTKGTLEIRTDYVEPAVLVKSISLSETIVNLKEKETKQLEVKIVPEDAADKSIKWESSNPDVATVSEDGLIEAISEGTCTVTASTLDGSDLSVSCEVTVDKESDILNVSIDGVKVRIEGGYIYVAGVKAGDVVGLYNLAGVHCNTIVSDGSEVRFEAAPAQYYIVRVGKASIKVRL